MKFSADPVVSTPEPVIELNTILNLLIVTSEVELTVIAPVDVNKSQPVDPAAPLKS